MRVRIANDCVEHDKIDERKYVFCWRCRPCVPNKPHYFAGKRPAVQTFEDVYWAANLAGAVEAWGRKSYINAEAVAVRLIESGRAEAARTVSEGRAEA